MFLCFVKIIIPTVTVDNKNKIATIYSVATALQVLHICKQTAIVVVSAVGIVGVNTKHSTGPVAGLPAIVLYYKPFKRFYPLSVCNMCRVYEAMCLHFQQCTKVVHYIQTMNNIINACLPLLI